MITVNDHINLALAQKGCSALGGMEHALTQQIGLRAPIHLPLDRLESVDLTLHLAGAPAARQGRLDGSAVPTHSVHETEELGPFPVPRALQPAIHACAVTGA